MNTIKESVVTWWKSDPGSMGAALAYYTIFSLTPLLFIIITIAGFILGPQAISGQLVPQIQQFVGYDAAQFISTLVVQIQRPSTGLLTTLISVVTLIIGSVGVFSQLQQSLNKLWQAPVVKRNGFLHFIEEKLSAFGMVIALGFLFVVSFVLSAISSIFSQALNSIIPHFDKFIIIVNFGLSFILTVFMFMLIYKYLSNIHITWRAALFGALVTGVLFIIGRFLISLYLHINPLDSSFGAASAVIFILVWIYYSSQIFFLGASFTHTINNRLK